MLSTAAKIQIARVMYFLLHQIRRPFGGRDQVQVKRRGLIWKLDLREGIDLTIYTLGAFEQDTLRALESLVKPGETVLDIGANIGAHTLHLARLVGPGGRVIAFEPTDFAIEKLRANLEANPELKPRVDVRQAFLVAEAGGSIDKTLASSWPVDGTVPDDADMGSRAMAVSGARAVTLDSAMAASGDPRVSLMKMDVDGHELEVLQGARALIARCRPTIVMELAPYVFHPGEKFDQMVSLLVASQYVFRPLGSSRSLPKDPSVLRTLIPRVGSVNVVAFPEDMKPA